MDTYFHYSLFATCILKCSNSRGSSQQLGVQNAELAWIATGPHKNDTCRYVSSLNGS